MRAVTAAGQMRCQRAACARLLQSPRQNSSYGEETRLRPGGCPCRVLEALGPLCAQSLQCPRLRVRGRHAPHRPLRPPLPERWFPRLPLTLPSSARCPSRWLTRSPGRAARPLPCVLPGPRSHRPEGRSQKMSGRRWRSSSGALPSAPGPSRRRPALTEAFRKEESSQVTLFGNFCENSALHISPDTDTEA